VPAYHIEFLTATILHWQTLLADDRCKQIITNALQWLTEKDRCKVHAFVIMPNHIHLIWKINDALERSEVQGALFSFTAHEFKKYFKANYPQVLQKYYVADADRNYQFWQRIPMVKECWSHSYFIQKLEYIHYNPCQPHWNLVTIPEDYKWSSAAFYETGVTEFLWLKHYAD